VPQSRYAAICRAIGQTGRIVDRRPTSYGARAEQADEGQGQAGHESMGHRGRLSAEAGTVGIRSPAVAGETLEFRLADRVSAADKGAFTTRVRWIASCSPRRTKRSCPTTAARAECCRSWAEGRAPYSLMSPMLSLPTSNSRRFPLTLRFHGNTVEARSWRWHPLALARARDATTSCRVEERIIMVATSMRSLAVPAGGSRRMVHEKGWSGRPQRRGNLRLSLCLWVALASWLGSACDADQASSSASRVIAPALKAAGGPDLGAIFGMETPSAWSTVTPGAVLGQSSTHSQGSYSLSVRPSNSNGFTPIKSVALTTLPVVSPTLAVDMMLPRYQPNPWWYGTAQAYIDCPSRSIWSQFLGQVELTGRPLGVWTTVNFTLTNAWITALLQAGYSDLTITVVLNVQVPTTGVYYVDNLRFVPVASNGCGGRPNGTSCTDNSACTLGDTCQSGSCHSGTAVTCTASDQCHDVGTCDPATGVCSNPAKPGTPPCNDGNACTQDDRCQAGVCVSGTPVTCTALDQCHDAGTCDPSTGQCSNPPKTGTGCDDGNPCTQSDTCQDGECVSGPEMPCTALDQCHDVGTCEPSTGQCTNPPKTGNSCEDGQACTEGDTCQDGVGGPPATMNGVAATSGGAQISLTWSPYPGATSYHVKRSTISGGPYTTVGTTTDTSYSDASMSCGVALYYVVTAVSTCGESPDVGEVAAWCAATPPVQPIPGYEPPPDAPVVGLASAAMPITLSIGLPLRNAEALRNLVDQAADPTSTAYRHHVTSTELASNYLPVADDYGALVTWANSKGLSVGTYGHRLGIAATGTAAQIAAAFHANVILATRPDGSQFYRLDRLPGVDLDLPLLGVAGLDNYRLPQVVTATAPIPGSFQSSDLRTAYLDGPSPACAPLNGSGQTIGILSLTGYTTEDIIQYRSNTNLSSGSHVQLQLTPDLTSSLPVTGNLETYEISLDIEAAMAMAPEAQVVVFEGENAELILQSMVDHPTAMQLSTSWGIWDSPQTTQLLTVLAAQGKSFFTASGDGGSYQPSLSTCPPNVPTPDVGPSIGDIRAAPYVTVLGGTVLGNANVPWAGDMAWWGSGGGIISPSIPDYQQGVVSAWGNPDVSTTKRNLPDVAMPATSFYIVTTNCNNTFSGLQTGQCVPPVPPPPAPDGGSAPDGGGTPGYCQAACPPSQLTTKEATAGGQGTSISSPLFAGMTALINQHAAQTGLGPIGFANPALYRIANIALNPTRYATAFHDQAGAATAPNSCGFSYGSRAGYDLLTGLGSPRCGLVTEMNRRPVVSVGVSGSSTGPVVCVNGQDFTPNGTVTVKYAGVPELPANTLKTVATSQPVNSSGSFQMTDDERMYICQQLQGGLSGCPSSGSVYVSVVDNATGISATTTMPANYWCAVGEANPYNGGCNTGPLPEVGAPLVIGDNVLDSPWNVYEESQCASKSLSSIGFPVQSDIGAMDINGDGWAEIFLAYSGWVNAYDRNGTSLAQVLASGTTANYPAAMAVGNLFGDGSGTLAVGDQNQLQLYRFVQNGSSFSVVAVPGTSYFGVGGNANMYTPSYDSNNHGRIATCDFNRDGYDELIAMGPGLSIYTHPSGRDYAKSGANPCTNWFKVPPGTTCSTPILDQDHDRIACGDLNGDGYPEVIVVHPCYVPCEGCTCQGGSYDAYSYSGASQAFDNSFWDQMWMEPFAQGDTMSAGDLDGDGYAEIVIAHYQQPFGTSVTVHSVPGRTAPNIFHSGSSASSWRTATQRVRFDIPRLHPRAPDNSSCTAAWQCASGVCTGSLGQPGVCSPP
jgi:hypothetical protein